MADRSRLSEMGTGNARLIADAVTAALGLPTRRGTDRHNNHSPDPAASFADALTSGVNP